MKNNRLIAMYSALILREKNQDRIIELANGLHIIQQDRIKELEKENAALKLAKKYKKIAS